MRQVDRLRMLTRARAFELEHPQPAGPAQLEEHEGPPPRRPAPAELGPRVVPLGELQVDSAKGRRASVTRNLGVSWRLGGDLVLLHFQESPLAVF
jgi:hypothetical protein